MGCRHKRHIRPNRQELIGCRLNRHKRHIRQELMGCRLNRHIRRELMGESLLAGSLIGYDIFAFTRK